jgi:hypothetical protein
MTEPATSTQFLDAVAADLRVALEDLDRREAAFGDMTVTPERDRAWTAALERLEGNLTDWQGILGDMAERVRVAQGDLNALDADLKRSLAAFSAARKYLQGSDREAASGFGS